MEIDRDRPANVAVVIGWGLLALGVVVWLAVVPLTAAALVGAEKISVEAGFATLGAVSFGVTGGVGFSVVAASRHRSARVAACVYGTMVLAATVNAILLNW